MAMGYLVRNSAARMAKICQAKASLLFSLLLLTGPAFAAAVLSVGDGDTLTASDGGRRVTVRLACIDAPESAQKPYGPAAREHLQKLAPVGSIVTLKPQTTDRYGRTVAEVIRNGQSVNLAMVRDGHAFAYREYLGNCDSRLYLSSEGSAQKRAKGVWSVPGGIQRPWDFRAGRRNGTTTSPAPRGLAAPTTGQRFTCRQIGSYARAQELLRQGHSYLDKNGNGVACESLQ